MARVKAVIRRGPVARGGGSDERIVIGDLVIDATVGNGHDTFFLAQKVGPQGLVIGFDIQQQALQNTQLRLRQHGLQNHVCLLQCGHEHMARVLSPDLHGKVRAMVFNLGYLPGSDHGIITRTSTTLSALRQGVSLLATQGLLSVLAYPAHGGGKTETQAITSWLTELDPKCYQCAIRIPKARSGLAPQWISVGKRG